MLGTIATRAAEGQRAHGGVRTFSGAHGDTATSGEPRPGHARRVARSAPSAQQIREAGEVFLEAVFGEGWSKEAPMPEVVDALFRAPLDNQWIERRVEKLKLKEVSEGPARLIPHSIWNLSSVLMQRDDEWFDAWKHFALQCPREWLVQFCGVAMLTGSLDDEGRRQLRSIDNRRAQSLLAFGILAWHLGEYDPEGDPSGGHYAWVIRGLPYGAYQHLLSYWEQHVDRTVLKVPAASTLFGTHAPGGRWDRGGCGYIAALKKADVVRTSQPCGWNTPAGMRGKPRKNKDGEWECWAFVEIRLRIAAPKGERAVVMGPPPPPPAWRRRTLPPPATGELEAIVNELERSWYTDEEPKAPLVIPAARSDAPAAIAERPDALGSASLTGPRLLHGSNAQSTAAPLPQPASLATSAELHAALLRDPQRSVQAPPAENGSGVSGAPTAAFDPRSVMAAVGSLQRWSAKAVLTAAPNESNPSTSSEPNFRQDESALTREEALRAAALNEQGQRFLEVQRKYEAEMQRRAALRSRKPPG